MDHRLRAPDVCALRHGVEPATQLHLSHGLNLLAGVWAGKVELGQRTDKRSKASHLRAAAVKFSV